MKYMKFIMSLLFIVSVGTLVSVAPSSEVDLQGYLADTNAENSKFTDAIKKAGSDKVKITKASKAHAKAIQAIRQKHKAGLREYYKSAYQQDDVKRKAWQTAEAALKKQYQAKLGTYWDKLKQIEKAFSDSMSALRAEYSVPLKAYEQENRKLVEKYW
jgi:hypothetical protein